jgi:rhomboid-related protein 1/2/3
MQQALDETAEQVAERLKQEAGKVAANLTHDLEKGLDAVGLGQTSRQIAGVAGKALSKTGGGVIQVSQKVTSVAGNLAEKVDVFGVYQKKPGGESLADLIACLEGGDEQADKHSLTHHCNHPPYGTAILILCFAVTYFKRQDGKEDYDTWSYSEERPGWTAVASWLSHLNTQHVLSNVALMALVGPLLESTEGPLVVMFIFFAGVFMGNAMHGHFNQRYLIGASGGIYAVEFAQLATLAMNWTEMQLRYFRLSTILIIAIVEIVGYYTAKKAWLSYAAHIGGALAGVLTGCVVVRNVAVRQHEIKLTWACVSLYIFIAFLLCVVPPAQPNAGGATLGLAPVLVGVAVFWTRKLGNKAVLYVDDDDEEDSDDWEKQLNDIYRKHNPAKLNDPEFAEKSKRLLTQYAGQEQVLVEKLKKQFAKSDEEKAALQEKQYQKLLRAFHETDADGSGSISPEERTKLFAQRGVDTDDPAVQEKMLRRFDKADENNDGRISLLEYMSCAGFEERLLQDQDQQAN